MRSTSLDFLDQDKIPQAEKQNTLLEHTHTSTFMLTVQTAPSPNILRLLSRHAPPALFQNGVVSLIDCTLLEDPESTEEEGRCGSCSHRYTFARSPGKASVGREGGC